MPSILIITILAYVICFFYLLLNLIKTPENKIKYFQRSLGVVLILHMVSLSDLMLIDNGLDLSLFKTFTLIAFIINAVIFISSFNKSLHLSLIHI